jgi:hypothetical protein
MKNVRAVVSILGLLSMAAQCPWAPTPPPPDDEEDCPICGLYTERYSCSGDTAGSPCMQGDSRCFDNDVCSDFTFEKTADGIRSTDGFLVGTLSGHTLTWRGETPSGTPDTGYREVGVMIFNDDFSAASGTSCYVVDDGFLPALGDTSCDPPEGAPPWQAYGFCTKSLERGNRPPAAPADVGCCTDAPVVHDSCGT